MDTTQVKLVQDSFAQVKAIKGYEFTETFYDILFAFAPHLEKLFPEDMGEQSKKLMDTLEVAVNGLNQLEKIIPAVQALGRRHKGYGAEAEHYDLVGQALILSLEEHLGDDLSIEAKASWVVAYSLLAEVMIKAQNEA